MTPAEAVKLDSVELKIKPYEPEDVEPTDGLYRYLLQPGEEHGDQKRRATDINWSRKTFRLDRIVEDPGQRVLYYLTDASPSGSARAPERAFVREELMLISEDTEPPPDWVKEW